MKLTNATAAAFLIAASSAVALAVAPGAAHAEAITLECSWANSPSYDYRIDMTTGSIELTNPGIIVGFVSISNAQVTDRSIRFSQIVGVNQETFVIDRISGGFSMSATWTDPGLARVNPPWSRTGQCTKIANAPIPARAF